MIAITNLKVNEPSNREDCRREFLGDHTVSCTIKAPLYVWVSLDYSLHFMKTDLLRFMATDIDIDSDFSFDDYANAEIYKSYVEPYIHTLNKLRSIDFSELSEENEQRLFMSVIKMIPLSINLTCDLTLTLREVYSTELPKFKSSMMPEIQTLAKEIESLPEVQEYLKLQEKNYGN